jgi:hypothetical protein
MGFAASAEHQQIVELAFSSQGLQPFSHAVLFHVGEHCATHPVGQHSTRRK